MTPDPTPDQLAVVAWPDPAVEAAGHRPGCPYVHLVWLGCLGPTTTLLWERLARLAAARPTTTIDATDLAVSLGLGEGLGRNAPLSRSLHRLVAFDTARRAGAVIAVRLALPDVPARHLCRLSGSARAAHDRLAVSARLQPTPAT